MIINLPLCRIAVVALVACILDACGGGGGGSSSYPAPTTMSGAVSGLKSGSVVIEINGANPITFSANGSYSDQIPNSSTNSYVVSVVSQPTGQICAISSGYTTGVVDSLNNVQITCSTATFQLGVAVRGLANFDGPKLELTNNSSDLLQIIGNGQVSFDVPIPYDGSYSVSVVQQPAGQNCAVLNGTGANVVAAVSAVNVACTTNTYTVPVTVSGLTGGQVTLVDNGSDPLVVGANGVFTFAVPIDYGSSYAVTIEQQPVGQTCVVTNSSQYSVVSDISSVNVMCSP